MGLGEVLDVVEVVARGGDGLFTQDVAVVCEGYFDEFSVAEVFGADDYGVGGGADLGEVGVEREVMIFCEQFAPLKVVVEDGDAGDALVLGEATDKARRVDVCGAEDADF